MSRNGNGNSHGAASLLASRRYSVLSNAVEDSLIGGQSKSDDSLVALNVQLTQQNSELTEANGKLSITNSELAVQNGDLSLANAKLSQQLQSASTQHQVDVQVIAKREEEIRGLNEELEQLRMQVTTMGEELKEKTRLADLVPDLQEQNKKLSQANEGLSQRNQQLSQANSNVRTLYDGLQTEHTQLIERSAADLVKFNKAAAGLYSIHQLVTAPWRKQPALRKPILAILAECPAFVPLAEPLSKPPALDPCSQQAA